MNEDDLNLPGGEDDSLDELEPEQDELEVENDDDNPEGQELADTLTEDAAAVPPSASYRPFQPTGNAYLDRARQRLEEYGLGDIADDLRLGLQHELSQGFTAQGYSQSYQEQAQSVAPEWTKTHAPAMRQAESALPPAMQGTAAAKVFAFIAPAMEHAQSTGDVAGAIRMIQASAGKPQVSTVRPVQQNQSAPRAVTPSPSAGGGGAPPARPQEAKATKQAGSRASSYLQNLGYDKSEARRLQDKVEI